LGEIALTSGELAVAHAYLVQAIPFLNRECESLYVGVFVAMAHTHLAEIALAYGNPSQARYELCQALPQARLAIRRLRCLLVTLTGILLYPQHTTATQEVPTKDVTAASELLGTVAGLGERTGDTLSPFHQRLIAQRSAAAQRLLTQSIWQTAWQQGHTWTPTQAADAAERWLALSDEK